MQGKNKYRKNDLPDFLRYHGDDMNDQERNAFERSLQQDPFAEEAAEGFAKAGRALANKDISELRKRLDRRISGSRKYLWYRVAASVAALMILASVFVFDRSEKSPEQIAITPESPVVKENKIQPDSRQEETAVKDQVVMVTDNKVRPVAEQPDEVLFTDHEPVTEEVIAATTEVVSVAEAEVKEAEAVRKVEKILALPATGIAMNDQQVVPVRGKIIASDDNQPLPGASVTIKGTSLGTIADTGGNFSLNVSKAEEKLFVASFVGMEPKEFKAKDDSNLEIRLDPSVQSLNETVVVGYGVKKARTEPLPEESIGYSPPQPVNGQADFDRYIRENIRRPESTATGQRAVVVLSFMVDEKGRPDSITVVRSPGKSFSDEAIRLLKEGPRWKPAEENGNTLREEVSIRIVFK